MPDGSPRLARSARQLRDELEQLIREDLIGPLGGPEEELLEAPVDRYLLGLLAPRFSFDASLATHGHETPSISADGGDASDEEGAVRADELVEDELATGGVV